MGETSVHAINTIWLSVTNFRHDESRKTKSVSTIFVFHVLGFGVIFRRSTVPSFHHSTF